MDPSTGKILAMVSKPDFDPNTVSQNWNELSTSEDSVLLNRATQGQYAPGSTFKLVTTLESCVKMQILIPIPITVQVLLKVVMLQFIAMVDTYTDR